MAVRINHNQGSVQTLLNLQKSDRNLNATLQRLSSGVRIGRAADDPAGLVIADGLRQQITSVQAATANVENGVGMLQTADAAAGEMNGLLNRMRELALNAASTAVSDGNQLEAMQAEFDEAVRSITRIADQTRLGSISLLKGGLSGNTLSAEARTDYVAVVHDQVKLPGGIKEGSTITMAAPSFRRGYANAQFSGPPLATATILGSVQDGTTLSAIPAATTLSLTGPLGSQVVALTAATTFDDVVTSVNAATATTGLTASFTNGLLTVLAQTPGPFAISVNNDLTGGANIGLLDSNTASATANTYVSTLVEGTSEGFTANFSAVAGAAVPPAGSAAINGTFQNGTLLDAVAGGTLTVRGATGTAAYDLLATTTFDELVARINADRMATGAFAAYDSVTGQLTIVNREAAQGRLEVRSSDMTSLASTVGLLDDDTASAANGIANQTSNLRHERIAVDLRTALGQVPAGSMALNGLRQNGTALAIAGGEQVTVGGIGGSQTFTLSASTTVQQFVDLVNNATRTTGVRAAYDAGLGQLVVEAATFGSGTLTVQSADLTGGGNVGLLDGDTTSALANPLGAAKDAYRMAFTTTSNGVAPAVVTAADSIFGLTGPGFIFDDVHDGTTGKKLTVFGNGASATLELKAPTTGTGMAAFLAGQIPNAGWDAAAGTLSFHDNALPNPAVIGSLAVTNQTTPQQFAAYLTATPGILAASQLQSVTVAAGRLTLTRQTPSAAMPAGSAAALAASAAATVHKVVFAGGSLDVYDDGYPTPSAVASLAVGGTTTVQEVGAFLNSPAVAAQTRATVAVGAGSAVFTWDPAASQSIGGTTVQDVVDFVNANTATLGAVASFTAGSLASPSTLDIRGLRGPINLASETMTTAGIPVGLMDLDTTSIDSTGTVQVSRAANASMDFTYVDAAGVSRTIRLVQDPNVENGTVFTNLNGGPEQAPPFSGWQAGAFRVKARDQTGGSFGGVIQAAAAAQTAERISTVGVQTGGSQDQRTTVEVADLRAGNLGRTAYRADLADTTGPRLLVGKGLDSLEQAVVQQSLVHGDAQQVLTLIDSAIEEVGTARGRIGALQATSLEPTLSSLQVGYANLVDAESRIRDTDFALESANFVKQQILFQAATSMLAQANQIPQTVLQLLK